MQGGTAAPGARRPALTTSRPGWAAIGWGVGWRRSEAAVLRAVPRGAELGAPSPSGRFGDKGGSSLGGRRPRSRASTGGSAAEGARGGPISAEPARAASARLGGPPGPAPARLGYPPRPPSFVTRAAKGDKSGTGNAKGSKKKNQAGPQPMKNKLKTRKGGKNALGVRDLLVVEGYDPSKLTRDPADPFAVPEELVLEAEGSDSEVRVLDLDELRRERAEAPTERPPESRAGGRRYALALARAPPRGATLPPLEAVERVLALSSAKFVETIEVHVGLNLDGRYPDQQLRAIARLPHGTGRRVRVVALSDDPVQLRAARDAGALEVGGSLAGVEGEGEAGPRVGSTVAAGAVPAVDPPPEAGDRGPGTPGPASPGAPSLLDRIRGGWLEFDKLVTTPSMVPKVARLGRLLGPRGLMPSPKAGTVASDLGVAVRALRGGAISYRMDRAANVHVGIGKADFPPRALLENLRALAWSIDQNRPRGAKGVYWRALSLCSTHGPSVHVDLEALRSLPPPKVSARA